MRDRRHASVLKIWRFAMNKHIEKAMELRNETPMVSNCSQTIMRCYAEDMGISEEMAAGLGL